MTIRYLPAVAVIGGVVFTNAAQAGNGLAGPEKRPFPEPDMAGFIGVTSATSADYVVVESDYSSAISAGEPFAYKLPWRGHFTIGGPRK